jgi:hypothetical protein
MFPGYENKCPILAEVRPWYKSDDQEIKDRANKYWKKRSYLFQGFVRDTPLKEDSPPESPIRRFIISPQIFTLIKSALMDPELSELPTDYTSGLDFTIYKTAGKGGYSDYNTSKWARKESALTAAEQDAIEQYGLFNLAEFLPKMPTKEEMEVMVDMFHASVNGEEYDPALWGNFFKPIGFHGSNVESDLVGTAVPKVKPVTVTTKPTTPAEAFIAAVTETPDDTASPATASTSSASGNRAEDILALIRNRQKQAAS